MSYIYLKYIEEVRARRKWILYTEKHVLKVILPDRETRRTDRMDSSTRKKLQ
jgi:hypothetical protein